MKNVKWFIPFIAITAILIVISCGDDESPAGPGDAPTASILSATSGTTNTVFASWSMCPDNDFSEYNLYRSTSSGISGNPPSSPIRTSSNASDTTYSDTGLAWGETYYYAVQTKNTGSNTTWSNEVQVVIADSGSTSGYLTCYQVQGQQSSSPYDSLEVSVTGIVTAGGGELYGGYAVLNDAGGGPWSGLVIYGDSAASLTRGDSITITGTVDEYFGLTELKYPLSFEVRATGHSLPDAISLTTAQVCDEQYEGVVVSVTNAIVLTKNDYSYEIDDGSGSCYIGTRGNFTEPSVGDTIDVQGPLFYEQDEWRIQPRDNNDISGSGGGGTAYTCYEIQGQLPDSPFNGQTVSVTGIITADPDDYTATSSTYSVLSDAGGGPWSGLLMYSSDLAGLTRGDSVTVTGVVDEYYGMTELKYPLSYVIHSSGHSLPAPEQMITGDLATAVTPEQWESVFVTVTDLDVTQIGLPWYTWAIDDGSGECYAGTMGDFTYVPAVGDTISSFTGALWYSRDNFKIEPRDDSDIII
jgi:predicted extracellular nuclease